jgi:hypothetical protein
MHIHMRIYLYVHLYIYVKTEDICIYIQIYIHISQEAVGRIILSIYVCISTCIYVYKHKYIYVYIHKYIYIYMHTNINAYIFIYIGGSRKDNLIRVLSGVKKTARVRNSTSGTPDGSIPGVPAKKRFLPSLNIFKRRKSQSFSSNGSEKSYKNELLAKTYPPGFSSPPTQVILSLGCSCYICSFLLFVCVFFFSLCLIGWSTFHV